MDGSRQTDSADPTAARSQQIRRRGRAPAGGCDTATLAADETTLLMIALVEGPGAERLTVEIFDPAGSLVATSVPAPGRSLATAVPRGTGAYTVRVTNPGGEPIAYRLTTVRQFER